MNPERRGVDVIVDDLETAPWCPHGPTLLFERFFQNKPPRKFYACSAYRDRHGCPFFQWADEKESESKRELRMSIYHSVREEEPSRSILSARLHQVKTADAANRGFCKTCCALVTTSARADHQRHDVTFNLSNNQLHRPTLLLPALEDSKSYAQYLFSESSVQFLVKRLGRLGFRHLLCLGSPRIHEQIVSAAESGQGKILTMNSFLLDFDRRFAHFFSAEEYQHFNMFNRHFFDGDTGREHLLTFLRSAYHSQLALVLDPPFGGLGEPLAACVRWIWKLASTHCKFSDSIGKGEDGDRLLQGSLSCSEIATVWVFPYFLESQVTEALPSLSMLDYKVGYENHSLYNNKATKPSSRLSPVRLFTNISPNQFALPTDEGYRFCKPCNRYVAPENRHCAKCNACTSKDGRPYHHCDQCKTCVKQGRVHCETCASCLPGEHQCRTADDCKDARILTSCHVCGEQGHKRRNCPMRAKPTTPTAKRRKRS